MVTSWERANLSAHLYVTFYCVFVTFLCGVLGQVWCVIVSISDLCLLSDFSYTVLSVACSLVVTRLEGAELLALLCEMFSCVFVTFQCGVLGQVWYSIVSILYLCILLYFDYLANKRYSIEPLYNKKQRQVCQEKNIQITHIVIM